MGKMSTFGGTGLKKGKRIQVLTQKGCWRTDEGDTSEDTEHFQKVTEEVRQQSSEIPNNLRSFLIKGRQGRRKNFVE